MRIIIILIVLCLIGGGIYLFVKINNQPIDQSQLKQTAQSVDQTASEGKFLAQAASGSRLSDNYIEEQSKQLSDQLTPLKQKLDSSPAKPSLKTQVKQQINLITTTQDLLKQLGDNPHDSSKIQIIAQRLQNISDQEQQKGNGQ